jgi:hypothetical protein
MTDRLLVLQIVRLRGRVPVAAIAESAGLAPEAAESVVAGLRDAGLVEQQRDRVKLTDSGRTELAALVAAERAGIDARKIADAYEEFHPVNSEFKQLITDWQLKDADTPNDHSDAEYDAGIVVRLNAIHGDFRPLLSRMVEVAPRLSRYPDRFDVALEKVNVGDHTWVARPLIDSYHTSWFELHEDLIGLCGLTRLGEAAAGRAQ